MSRQRLRRFPELPIDAAMEDFAPREAPEPRRWTAAAVVALLAIGFFAGVACTAIVAARGYAQFDTYNSTD